MSVCDERTFLNDVELEDIDNVFLKNGNNILSINRNAYNNASKYINDEIKKLESKQNKIKELIDKYGLED